MTARGWRCPCFSLEPWASKTWLAGSVGPCRAPLEAQREVAAEHTHGCGRCVRDSAGAAAAHGCCGLSLPTPPAGRARRLRTFWTLCPLPPPTAPTNTLTYTHHIPVSLSTSVPWLLGEKSPTPDPERRPHGFCRVPAKTSPPSPCIPPGMESLLPPQAASASGLL